MRGIPISGPQGGRIKNPPASGPRLGRSLAEGLHPRPPGLRPLARLRAPGPCCLGYPAGGVPGTGATVAGVGNRLRLSMPTPSPSPSPWIQFFKSKATGAWASRRLCPPENVGPCSGGGGQTPAPPAGRLSTLGGQRGCPRPERATGRSACATRFPPAAGAPPSLRRIRGRFS